MSNSFMVGNIQHGKCWQCSKSAKGYDFLTQKLYCADCYPELTKTARHKHYEHLRIRLMERYSIELDLPMYFNMLSQINNSDTHTWLYKVNAHKSVHKVSISYIFVMKKLLESYKYIAKNI